MINEPKPTGVLRAKLGGAVVQLRHLPRVFAMVWEDSRGLTAAWAALLVVQGLLPVATVTLSRYLVDNVVGSLNAGLAPEVIRRVLWPAGLMGAALVTSEIVGGVLAWIRKNQTERITDRIAQDIHRTATAVDLEFYESPDYYDRLHRARSEASYRPQRIVENTGALVQGTITLLAMAGILLQFNLWVPVVLLVSTAPGFFVVAGHAVRQHLWRRRNTTDERRLWYYDYEMTRAPSAAELRLFDLGGFFKQRYRELRARLLREKLELFRAQSLSEAAAGLFALIAMAASVAWVGWRALEGDFSAGDIALFYFAFRRGQDVLRSLLGNLGDVYRNVLFIGDLFEFLDSKPAIVDPVEPRLAPDVVEQGLRFERVDFSYPGSSRRVLEEIGRAHV
jgi:ATP-binding cassette, subfamily B, bacterial